MYIFNVTGKNISVDTVNLIEANHTLQPRLPDQPLTQEEDIDDYEDSFYFGLLGIGVFFILSYILLVCLVEFCKSMNEEKK